MSLISVQNLVAPFKSTTNVVTMVLIALIVGAYRYAGGSVTTRPSAPRAATQVVVDPLEPEVEDGYSTKDSKRQVLDDLIGKDDKKPSGSDASLDELERQLGLR